MAGHVKAACAECVVSSCKADDRRCHAYGRAHEVLIGGADSLSGRFDPFAMKNIDELSKRIFAGGAIESRDLNGWCIVSLWKLRNAVFARHGRPFKHPDLTALFTALGRKADPSYTDGRLTKIDKKNLRVIRAVEKKTRR